MESSDNAATTAFVGRARIIGDLQRLVADAAAGHGGLVLIAGEPGIGKTSLLGHLATRRPDVRALWGSCWEGDGAPALWPWIQILRGVAGHAPAVTHDAILSRLVPELGDATAAHAPLEEQTRFQLFDAMARLLKAAAAEQPLLLVFDDLHWADTSSLLLLGFVIPELRTSRIAIVGSYRDIEVPPGHALHRILSARSGVIHLAGLEPPEVAELVRAELQRDPAPDDVALIHRTTGGNPFFVREMLRLPAAAEVPDSVGEVIRRRVERLSAPARVLLGAAAVIGHDLRLDVLGRVVETRSLAEVLSARLLEEDLAAVARLRFTHAVVREVIYHSLPPDERMELHRRVGEALELSAAQDSELAHHFAQSALLGTTARAIDYAEKAGHRALAMLAYEDAASHFDSALALLAADDRRRRAELLFALGRAHRAAGHTAESHAAFVQVARLTPPPELLAATALAFGVEFTAGIVDQAEVELLEQALAALPATDHPLRARVLARLAKTLLFSPATSRRVELTDSAAAMARRIGDPATLAAVLYDRHVAIWGGANVEERLAIASEVVELAQRCGDAELALQGHALRLGNLSELGDLAAFQAEVDVYEALGTRLRQPHYLWHPPLLRATLAAYACRFDVADQLAQQGMAMGRSAQHQGADVFYAAQIAVMRFAQGRFAELEPVLRRGAEQWPSLVTFRCGLAYALAEAGRTEEARRELEHLTADRLVNVPRDFTWVAGLTMLSLASAALGDRRAASVLYELLLPYRAYCVRLTRLGIGGLGAVAHYLGLLAATREQWDEAAEHLERAIETNIRIGAPAFVANSRYQYARVALARGDVARAHEERQRAEVAASSLGIVLALRQIDRRPAAAASEAVFIKDGDSWSIRFRGPSFRIKDAVGAGYIARLLPDPDHEVHVAELSGAETGAGAPLLDARARADYKERLRDLDEQAREAEARGDLGRAARAREEIEVLAEHLSQAVGLGGRDRRAASDVERARVRVTKAIKATIRRIAEHDPALADHLERSIRTGAYCSYAPDPGARIRWRT